MGSLAIRVGLENEQRDAISLLGVRSIGVERMHHGGIFMRHLGLVLSSLGLSTLGAAGALAVGCSSSTEASSSSGSNPTPESSTTPTGEGGTTEDAGPPSDGTLVYTKDSVLFRVEIADGEKPTQIFPKADAPSANADGTLLTFINYGAENVNTVRTIGLDGTGEKEVAKFPSAGMAYDAPILAADGNVYMTLRAQYDVMVVPAAGGTPTKWAGSPATPCELYSMTASRDRTKLALVAKLECSDNDRGFYVMPTSATAPPTLIRPAGVLMDTVSPSSLAFMPSGDKLAFYVVDGSGPALYSMALDGSGANPLLRLPADSGEIQGLAISKDGKWAYVDVRSSGLRRISIDPPGTVLEFVPGVIRDVVGSMVVID